MKNLNIYDLCFALLALAFIGMTSLFLALNSQVDDSCNKVVNYYLATDHPTGKAVLLDISNDICK